MPICAKYTWEYCITCNVPFVRCPKCNNNCCNASTGEIDGKKCGCEEAYAYQHKSYQDKTMPPFRTVKGFKPGFQPCELDILFGGESTPTVQEKLSDPWYLRQLADRYEHLDTLSENYKEI